MIITFSQYCFGTGGNKLTNKYEMFCHEYVNNGFNATDAYLVINPKSTRANAANTGYRLLQREDVASYVKELCDIKFKALDITGDKIVTKLAEIAFSPKGDEYYGASAQLKALEQLLKVYSLEQKNADKVIKIELK